MLKRHNQDELQRLADAIATADAIVVGAGAGLSREVRRQRREAGQHGF